MKYTLKNPVSNKYWFWTVAGFIAAALLVCLAIGWRIYAQNLKPLSHIETSQLVTIPSGASVQQISGLLKENSLIRSSWAFEWYVRTGGARSSLQAGTYSLKPSFSTPQIVEILSQGGIDRGLVTVLPGKRLDEIRDILINAGFDVAEVDDALNPASYPNHPALAYKPADASLEGYLYPESFDKDGTTKPHDIVRQSLDQMQERLTAELTSAIKAQGISVHQGIILASIVEKEVSSSEDRKKVAQVFLRRLREDMKLESDATAGYGAVLAGRDPTAKYDSAYNTYNNKGLTPSPISNVTQSSLEAVAHPADTNYLYFVSGDDGRTHFSHTLQEHQALTRQYCTRLCSR